MDKTKLINDLRVKSFDELRDALKKILLDYCSPSLAVWQSMILIC